MIGALIGDMAASRYISGGSGGAGADLLTEESELTDGALLTLCAAKAITESEGQDNELADQAAFWAQEILSQYGTDEAPEGAPSDGCFVAGPCGLAAGSTDDAARLATQVLAGLQEVEEASELAKTLAAAVSLCASGMSKEDVAAQLSEESFRMREGIESRGQAGAGNLIKDDVEVCAVVAFLNGADFEGVVRAALELSAGKPAVTAAAAAMGEAFFGVPEELEEKARELIGRDFVEVVDAFDEYVLTIKAVL